VIDLPDNGEKANSTNLNTAVKDAADNAQVALNALDYYTSQEESTRGTSDGFKRARRLTTLGNLSALSVGSTNDKETAYVDGNGLYQYKHGDVSGVNSPWIVDALSSTGRWHHVLSGIRATSPGLPVISSAGRLLGPTVLPTAIKAFDYFERGDSDATETLYNANNTTSFVDCSDEFTVSGVEGGEILDVSFTFLADCTGTASGANDIVALFGGQGSFAELQRTIVTTVANGGANIACIRQYTLRAQFQCANATDFKFKLEHKASGSSGANGKVYYPYHATVIRRWTP
jgi:hypothetical protein